MLTSTTRINKNGFIYKKVTEHNYVPDLELEGNKALRQDKLDTSYVTINGVEYDADEKSLDRMNRIVALANWKYNQGVASGIAPAIVYDTVYKQTVVWRGRDNLDHNVQIESIAEALYIGMENMSTLWETY